MAKRLDDLMSQRRMSNRQLGELIGKGHATIGRWRTGKNSPRTDDAEAMARVFRVDPAVFVESAADPELTEDERSILRVIRALGLDLDEVLRRLYGRAGVDPTAARPSATVIQGRSDRKGAKRG